MRITDLAIRKKFILSFSLLLLLGFLGGLISYLTFSKIHDFQLLRIQVAEVMLSLDKTQKKQKEFLLYGWKDIDFLEKGKSENTNEINHSIKAIQNKFDSISRADITIDAALSADIKALNDLVFDYELTFNQLVSFLHKRGFKDYGLEGQMRNYAHNLQSGISDTEKVYALTLRKHEKDFALRHDMKYVDKLHETAKKFEDFIKGADQEDYGHMSEAYKQHTLEVIEAYKRHFDKIVMTELEIGLSQNSGVLFELEKQINKTTPLMNYLYDKVNRKNEQLKQQAQITISLTVLFLIIGSLILIYFLRKTVSKPIIKLDKIIRSVLSGDAHADQKLDTSTKDEIGNLSRNFKLMLESLRENIKTINEKNAALEQKTLIDKERNWSVEGLSKFSEIMKSTEIDQQTLSFSIIKELVKYTNSNQGAIFIKEETEKEGEILLMKGCYAYNRRKYFDKRIEKGEGLIGQCWLERDSILLTDIPESYVNITSGLGEAPPTSVILMPVTHQNEVVAVIEMATFNTYSPSVIQFLKEFSNRLGASIHSVSIQEKAKNLLENSQEMAEQLQAQEEEIRQNLEELQATQEIMKKENHSLNSILEELKLEKKLFNQLIAKVYDGVIIIDSNYRIKAISSYLTTSLHYKKKDLIGEHPEIVFKASIDKEIEGLQRDPSFILTAISERKGAVIMDKYGKMEKVKYVLSTLNVKDETYSVLLFNNEKEEQDKKLLKRLSTPH